MFSTSPTPFPTIRSSMIVRPMASGYQPPKSPARSSARAVLSSSSGAFTAPSTFARISQAR
jgi:hypothetical protein